MKSFIQYIFCFLGFLTISCGTDFLKPEPRSFFSPENVFLNPAGYDAALATLRKDLTREQTSQKNFMAHQTMGSELGAPNVAGNADWRLLTPTSEASQRFVSQINDIFIIIKNANTIISRIDNIVWNDEKKRNQVLAEALWHRSYWYYRLVGCYGDLPFLGEEVKSAKLDYKSHSRWAILAKIQKDMEWAAEWMPVSAEPGQPSKGAGNHLLSKICLANMEWDKAITAASTVISGPYALMTLRFGQDAGNPVRNVIWDLHRPANKNIAANTETILAFVDRFEAPQTARTEGLYTMRVYNPAYHNSNNNRDKAGGIGFILSGPMYDTLGYPNPDCILSDYHAYDIWTVGNHTWETTPDLRRANINWVDRNEYFYNNPASVQYGKLVDPANFSIDPRAFPVRFYPTPHYKIFAPNHPDQTGLPYGSNGDWYIFRLAETYLLRAEAHYWKGDKGAAANDINVVRARAKAPLISAGDVTIDFIFDERARELSLEEPRQNELNRVSYIMAKMGVNGYSLSNIAAKNWFYDRIINLNEIYTRKNYWREFHIEPYHFQWPIDDKLINANTLGRINQNVGYVGAERNEPVLENID